MFGRRGLLAALAGLAIGLVAVLANLAQIADFFDIDSSVLGESEVASPSSPPDTTEAPPPSPTDREPTEGDSSPDPRGNGILPVDQAVLVSRQPSGAPGTGGSGRPSMSAEGRFVAFVSSADDLDAEDGNGLFDIFRHDLDTSELLRVSVPTGGGEANGQSQFPWICESGRIVAFASQATNLLPGRVFDEPKWRVYVHDVLDRRTILVSEGLDGQDPDGDSVDPVLSADCSTVAFSSLASNLTADDANGREDVFVRRLGSSAVELVSGRPDGTAAAGVSYGPSISADGSLVAFTSEAPDLTGTAGSASEVYLRRLGSGAVEAVSRAFSAVNQDGASGWASISGDGRFVTFRSLVLDPGARTGYRRGRHVFVWDVAAGASELIGPDGRPIGWLDACTEGVENGTRHSPRISDGGSGPARIVFAADLGAACGVVLRDLEGQDVIRGIGLPDQEALEPAVSSDGSVLAWAETPAGTGAQQVYACRVPDTADGGRACRAPG